MFFCAILDRFGESQSWTQINKSRQFEVKRFLQICGTCKNRFRTRLEPLLQVLGRFGESQSLTKIDKSRQLAVGTFLSIVDTRLGGFLGIIGRVLKAVRGILERLG